MNQESPRIRGRGVVNQKGLSVDHTTVYKWVQRYAPEIEKRLARI